MVYLIDTQIFIWALENNPRLSKKAISLLTNGDNSIFISIATLWEIAIKVSIGKLELTQSLEEIIRRLPETGIAVFAIEPKHILGLEKLPFFHRDPFDRIIIAQAIAENMEVISSDEMFPNYPITVHW